LTDYKDCSKCGKSRAAHNFPKRKDKLGGVCIDCRRAQDAERQRVRRKGESRSDEPPSSIYWLGIPTARLLPIIDRWREQNPNQFSAAHPSLFHRVKAFNAGIEFVTFDWADRMLIELGMEHEWHDSLADLYEGEPEISYSPAKRQVLRRIPNSAQPLAHSQEPRRASVGEGPSVPASGGPPLRGRRTPSSERTAA
jgi:hypothetical protein